MKKNSETNEVIISTALPFWKRYYYSYLDAFLQFLVPADARAFRFDAVAIAEKKEHSLAPTTFDYLVISDILGRVPDVQSFLLEVKPALVDNGRIIITQYNALWEPVLRLATILGLREKLGEQNWLSAADLENLLYISGFEPVKAGTKMILPIYIPLLSTFFNKIVANIWPFSHLGLFHYIVARKVENQKQGEQKPSLSIIVPARNEAGTIERIARELPNLGSFTEIIFIEGNSTDNTPAEIERVVGLLGSQLRLKFAKQKGKGKGDAVRLGFDMAEGDILAIYDADMTVPPEDVEKFYTAISENKAEFINGSRLVYPMEKESMRVLNFFGNKFFSLAFSWILGQQIKDTLCGTKVLWKKDYEAIKRNRAFFGDFDPFGDFDLLFGAAKQNRKIIDMPVHYRDRVYGTTNISRWSHGWLLLKMTVFAARKIKLL